MFFRCLPIAAFAAAVVAILAAGDVHGQEGTKDRYMPPDFSKRLLKVESTLLTREDGDAIAAQLAALASNPSLEEVSYSLREKALALAFTLDPVHRETRRTHSALSAGKTLPESVVTVPEIARSLAEAAESLAHEDESTDESRLRAYLLAIAIEADPEGQEESRKAFAEAAGKAGVTGWQKIVKLRPGAEPFLPEDVVVVPNVGNPSSDPGPGVDSVDDIQKLGFARSSASSHALTTRRIGPKGDRTTVTKFSKVTASVDLMDSAEREPRLRLSGFVLGGNTRGFRSLSLMQMLRTRHRDWPPRADVEVDFEQRDFGIPGRSCELAVALAADALKSGDEPASNVIPLGSVEKDGDLTASTDYGQLISTIPEESSNFVLVAPLAVESDLVDFAVEGNFELLARYQFFLAGSVDEAARIASGTPGENVLRAMLEFGQIQDALPEGFGLSQLREEKVYTRLQRVVALSPNHASAAVLLRAAEKNLPPSLSLRGSLRVLGDVMEPWQPVYKFVESPKVKKADEKKLAQLREDIAGVATGLDNAMESLARPVRQLAVSAQSLTAKAENYVQLIERGSGRAADVRDEIIRDAQSLKAGIDELLIAAVLPGGGGSRSPR